MLSVENYIPESWAWEKLHIWNAMPLSQEPPENFVMVVVGVCGGVLMYI